ncbi:MAG TPA: VanW family protein [Chthoniobacterales bacterium]|nr:VanW family protein [Chthoniobacterales bacterium]
MRRPKSALQVLDYRLRRAGLSAARLVNWLVSNRWPKPVYCRNDNGHKVAEIIVPISRADGFAHPALEQGKRRNLELAVPQFDGLLLTSQSPLSFWRVLGRASENRGFSWGMELRGGCVTPAIGGGLCLLSNAIFELAVRAGWKIIERHGHSLEAVPPAPGSVPLDATVAWPDVDLVVAPARGWARLAATISPKDELRLAIFADEPAPHTELETKAQVVHREGRRCREIEVTRSIDGVREVVAHSIREILADDELGKTCLSCGERSCRDRPKESVLAALRNKP